MRTPNDIRNMEFQRGMNGYKPADVEMFLEEIATDFEYLLRKKKELEKQITMLESKTKETDDSAASIQNVLITAQRLADQVVREAEDRAKEIVAEATEKSNQTNTAAETLKAETERVSLQLKKSSEAEATDTVNRAVKKSEQMIAAAHDSVARQQLLFDKLKVEIAAFKKDVMLKYREQAELIKSIPDDVPFDAQHAADAVAFEFDKIPDYIALTEEKTEENNEDVSAIFSTSEEETPEVKVEPEEDAALEIAKPIADDSKDFEVADTNEEFVDYLDEDDEPDFLPQFENKTNEEKRDAEPPIISSSSYKKSTAGLNFGFESDDDDDDLEDEPRRSFFRKHK